MKTLTTTLIWLIPTLLCSQLKSIEKYYPEKFGLHDSLVNLGYNLQFIEDIDENGTNDLVFAAVRPPINHESYTGGFWIGLTNNELGFDSLIYVEPHYINEVLELGIIRNLAPTSLGDIDNNGTNDFLLNYSYSYRLDSIPAEIRVSLLNNDYTIRKEVIYTSTKLGFPEDVIIGAQSFNLGDIDGDGYNEIACSVERYSDEGDILILSFDENGSIIKRKLLTNTWFTASNSSWEFGQDIDIADFNNDGITDLIIGTPHGQSSGTVIILYLNESLEVIDHFIIDHENYNPEYGILLGDTHFGESLAVLGDIDKNGSIEVAISTDWNGDRITHVGIINIISIGKDKTLESIKTFYDYESNLINFTTHEHIGTFMDASNDIDGDRFPELIFVADMSLNIGKFGYFAWTNIDYNGLYNLTSTADIQSEDAFKIVPNPSNSFIKLIGNTDKLFNYRIIDLQGREVLIGQCYSDQQIQIDNLENGYYNIQVELEGKVMSELFLKAE